MAKGNNTRIIINPKSFRDELSKLHISIRSFDDPNSVYYIGVCSKTIRRGIKEGWFSFKTLKALSTIMDISSFMVDSTYSDIELLQTENAKLKVEINYLKQEIDYLKQEINFYTLLNRVEQ